MANKYELGVGGLNNAQLILHATANKLDLKDNLWSHLGQIELSADLYLMSTNEVSNALNEL